MPNRAGRLAIAIFLTLAHTAVLYRFGGRELTNRLIAGGFGLTAESRIDRPFGRYCCFSFVTLNAFVLTPSLVARRGLKGKNKCYRRLKAWGLPIPDGRL